MSTENPQVKIQIRDHFEGEWADLPRFGGVRVLRTDGPVREMALEVSVVDGFIVLYATEGSFTVMPVSGNVAHVRQVHWSER